MKRFVLIDGNAIVHRAYHAMPKFTMSDGKPVGAVYGFTSMLLKAIADLKPAYLAVAFDRPKPTFRKLMYVAYQGTRAEMDDELASQFEGVYKILTALTIPIFGIDGYEADDVIGTLAARVVQKTQKTQHARKSDVSDSQKVRNTGSSEFSESSGNIEVIIVSGDRDLLQLVNGQVKIYMPIKGMTEAKMFGAKEVEEKYGLTPLQIVDMKALTGDASDNYPGVSGVGPKTASLLLQKYGTLEEIYKNLGEIGERQRNALAEGAEAAGLAKKLATIVTDVPFQFDIESCRFHVEDRKEAVAVFHSFEFRTLTDRLIALLEGKPVPDKSKEKSTLKITPKKPKDNSDQLSLI